MQADADGHGRGDGDPRQEPAASRGISGAGGRKKRTRSQAHADDVVESGVAAINAFLQDHAAGQPATNSSLASKTAPGGRSGSSSVSAAAPEPAPAGARDAAPAAAMHEMSVPSISAPELQLGATCDEGAVFDASAPHQAQTPPARRGSEGGGGGGGGGTSSSPALQHEPQSGSASRELLAAASAPSLPQPLQIGPSAKRARVMLPQLIHRYISVMYHCACAGLCVCVCCPCNTTATRCVASTE